MANNVDLNKMDKNINRDMGSTNKVGDKDFGGDVNQDLNKQASSQSDMNKDIGQKTNKTDVDLEEEED